MPEILEIASKEDMIDWLLNEGLAEDSDGYGHVSAERVADRLLACWRIYYVPHCGCDHHGDPEGCDPSCECRCKFEVRKIR